MFDLHVHDVDMIYWLFGKPEAVSSAGRLQAEIDQISTTYHYEDGPEVQATGAWVDDPEFAFRMHYHVSFADAEADWHLAREPRLMVQRGGERAAAPVREGNGYEWEIRAAVEAVSSGQYERVPTLDEAGAVLEILEAECRSVAAGGARVEVPR
jgi:predicted dehydrogenase